MNVPNALTCLRLVLIGVFVALFYTNYYIWAGIVYVLAAITDLLDGYIARKYDLITDFGKLMDPLADKLMLIAALWCLYDGGFISPIFVIIVAIKEVLIVLGGIFLYKKNVVVYSKTFGKIATFLFNVAVAATILNSILTVKFIYPYNIVLLYIALFFGIIALIQYAKANLPGNVVKRKAE